VTIANGSVNLMELLRLDRYSESGNGLRTTSSLLPYITIDESGGDHLSGAATVRDNIETYFANNENGQLPADPAERRRLRSSMCSRLYDTTYNGAVNSPKNRSGSRDDRQLRRRQLQHRFNVVEESVEVIVDGRAKRLE